MLLKHLLKEHEKMDKITTRKEGEELEKEQLYTAGRILDHRYENDRVLFELKWHQYEDSIWESILNVRKHMISQYLHGKRLAVPESVKDGLPAKKVLHGFVGPTRT